MHSLSPDENHVFSSAYGLEITDSLLPENSPLRTGRNRKIKYVVIHETANHAPTADAQSHSKYLLSGGDGSTAWHYTVDDKSAYRHIPDNEVAYHAGDRNRFSGGNSCGIGIEICVNNGSDFEKSLQNAAKLTAKLLKTYNLPLSNIKQHSDFMNKNCPETIRNSNRWDDFLSSVKFYLNQN